jgi:hypothetical protein
LPGTNSPEIYTLGSTHVDEPFPGAFICLHFLLQIRQSLPPNPEWIKLFINVELEQQYFIPWETDNGNNPRYFEIKTTR